MKFALLTVYKIVCLDLAPSPSLLLQGILAWVNHKLHLFMAPRGSQRELELEVEVTTQLEIGTDEIERSSVVSFGLPVPQRPNPVEPGNAAVSERDGRYNKKGADSRVHGRVCLRLRSG